MPKLPVAPGAQAVRAFYRDGWRVDRQRGGHAVLLKAGHLASLSIPQHREVSPGTLRSLIRSAGLSVEQFCELL